MIFTETELTGAFVVDLESRADDRGFFARAFCQHEFTERGLQALVAQTNIAFNFRKGTLRGLHFQFPPVAETKLVRCTRGAVYDVIVDLRPESPTYLRQAGVTLTADSHRAIYVPERFAHGYQVLGPKPVVLFYHVTKVYDAREPDEQRIPHDDPEIGFDWSIQNR